MIDTLLIAAGCVALAGLLIEIDNLRFFPLLRAIRSQGDACVDACIAMRNESSNAAACVEGLLRQNAVRGICIVDDDSSDETYDVLQTIALRDRRVRVARALGRGKAAALAQACAMSDQPWVFFTDADVRAQPGAVETLLAYARTHDLEACSAWPAVENRSVWDALLAPSVTLFLIQALPMRAAQRCDPRFSAATGQAFLVRRDAYDAAGGHVGAGIVEDVELARRLHRAGSRVALASGAALLRTSGYGSLGANARGLGRSLFYGAGATGAMLVAAWQLAVFVIPFVAACAGYRLAWIAILAALGARGILAIRMRQSPVSVGLTPVAGLLLAGVAVVAAMMGTFGKLAWRGRPLPKGPLS